MTREKERSCREGETNSRKRFMQFKVYRRAPEFQHASGTRTYCKTVERSITSNANSNGYKR